MKIHEPRNGEGRRHAHVKRVTSETDIELRLDVDGAGEVTLDTGIPFLEHMLDLFAKHGHFNLAIKAKGDLHIDDHHTAEDIAICLGQAFRQALGDKRGIHRYGNVFLPMDEALVQVAVDISNRPHLTYKAALPSKTVGRFPTELVHEFLAKFAAEARITLHVIMHDGQNTHHIIEAMFKGLGRALDQATRLDERERGIPSTKGVL